TKISKLLFMFIDESIPDKTSWGKVRTKDFKISPKNEVPKLIEHIEGKKCDETKLKWDFYSKMSRSLCKNLRPIVMSVDFKGEKPNDHLVKALDFIKETFGRKKSLKSMNEKDFPKEFIPKNLKKYLYTTETVTSEDSKESREVKKF